MTGYDAVSRPAQGSLPSKRPQLKDTEPSLFAKEALDVLALKPGGTPVEIKEAYRDMVKVWHPDRFGSDGRLRLKAEDKLKQINDAYRVLQSEAGTREAEAGKVSSVHFSSVSIPETRRARGNSNALRVRWILCCLAIVMLFWVGYKVVKHQQMRQESSSPASAQQVADPNPQTPPNISAAQTLAGAGTGRNAESQNSGGSSHSSHPSPEGFKVGVRSLSYAETSQLESACSRLKELQEQPAYQTCVKAQVDMITNAPGRPDLSVLSGTERESMERACAEAGRLHGANGYNRCLTVHRAELAAEPVRPDLSTLSDADRHSVELACVNAKNGEG